MPNDENHISNSQVDVDWNDLETFLSEMADKQRTVSEATGSLRSHLKTVLNDTGWHKKAAAMIRTIDAMSEEARADFLASFEPMFDVMLSKKWRDESMDFFKDPTERED